MSDSIKHECGIAMVRLRKPAKYYEEKYETSSYGLNILYLLMEKQHNRGQEGAGIACVKLEAQPGEEYIYRERAMGNKAISDIFDKVNAEIENWKTTNKNGEQLACPFQGDLYLGHLRYSTTGKAGSSYLHPFLRRNNWRSRNICLAGNFNLTNVDEILVDIVEKGQHPRQDADAFIILEQIGYLLDQQVEKLYAKHRKSGLSGQEVNKLIEDDLNLKDILKTASAKWDGGYVVCGLTGSGDSFVFRDPCGIRPAFYYADDEIIAVASERPVLQTILNKRIEDIQELPAGAGLIIKQNGEATLEHIRTVKKLAPCSFERIYFSRGSDRDIYRERKLLGTLLTEQILKAVHYDTDNTIFSYIPNTAEVAYYGMLEGLESYLNKKKKKELSALSTESNKAGIKIDDNTLTKILSARIRTEKLAIKDIKLRTFIAEDRSRADLAAHVYDITYGCTREGLDNIVVIDDSIVRGTTLKQSIIKILCRLNPRKIVIVSSAPQIRYPDCYGIAMSSMGEFIAFNATIELLQRSGRTQLILDVYKKCKEQEHLPKEKIINYVKEIYAPFTDEDISRQIANMVRPDDCDMDIEIVFQTIGNLHVACKEHSGDWYFSGNYPTPGGNRLVNNAFIHYVETNYATIQSNIKLIYTE